MSDGIAPANPPGSGQTVERLGSDATGTESAAQDFTEYLQQEEREKDQRSRPPRARREADSGGADEAEEGQGRERQPEKRERRESRRSEPQEREQQDDDPLRDDILDGTAGDDNTGEDDNDDEETEEEGDEPDAEEDEDEEDEDPEFEVRVAGVPTKVKQSELLASYSREADYRQKTEAHARDVELVQNFAGALKERRGEADALVDMAQDLIGALMPTEKEWTDLEAADPKAFILAQKQWRGFIEKANQLKTAREGTKGQNDEEQTVQYNRYVVQENQKLYDKVPALKNPKVQQQFADKIFAYGKKMNYTPEELKKGLVNHRDILTAYYAARFLEIQDSRNAQKKQQARKGPRQSEGNSAPRNAQTPQGRQRSRQAQRQQRADRELQRTGSLQSAGEAFRNMFT